MNIPSGIPIKTLFSLLSLMYRIRLFEEKIIELYPAQEMKTPVHLCVGQEAIAAGACRNLKDDDLIFSNHRNHGHCIAKGIELKKIMAELYGKTTGASCGKGGSMHLVDAAKGIYGTSAIVAGGLPLAVGAGLAIKMKKERRVSVVFFGDGAVDTGTFYESINFASLKKLPVIFICENNFYATNSSLLARQPADNIYLRVRPLKVRSLRIDGNDVTAVFNAVKTAIQRAREGAGPSLLECRTYRYRQHVGCNCDYETGCRPQEELMQWMKQCPIAKFEKSLLRGRFLRFTQITRMKSKIKNEVDEAVRFAQRSPFPKRSSLLTHVY